MKLLIEDFTTTTGWTFSDGTKVSISHLNEWPVYISGLFDKSLVVNFNTAANEYMEKTFTTPYDVTDYDELVFSVWSRNLKDTSDNQSVNFSNFNYKIDILSAEGYLIPLSSNFGDVTFDISSINSISKIRITALSNTADYLILSNMVVVVDELPRDIFQSVKEQLEYDLNLYGFQTKYLLGTVTTSAGDNDIDLTSDLNGYIDKNLTIKIDDGNNSEIHMIGDNDGRFYKFNSLYDGETVVNDFTNANVYIYFPVEFGISEKEAAIPSVTIWGFEPTEIIRQNKLENVIDNYQAANTASERKQRAIQDHSILLDIIGTERQIKQFGDLNQVCRNFIAREKLWINGRKFYFRNFGAPTYNAPILGYDQLYRNQYQFNIEVKEDLFNRVSRNVLTTNNLTVDIQS